MTSSPVRVLLVLGLLLLAGCSGGGEPDASPSASPSASATAAPEPDPAPAVGSCHRLTFDDATSAVPADDATVPCREEHTSVTVGVGTLDLVSDGHLLALDSDAAGKRLQQRCARELAWAGGDETTRRLSRLEAVWFAPSDEQVDLGADWLRCDLVAVRTEGELLRLPGKARGLLDRGSIRDLNHTNRISHVSNL